VVMSSTELSRLYDQSYFARDIVAGPPAGAATERVGSVSERDALKGQKRSEVVARYQFIRSAQRDFAPWSAGQCLADDGMPAAKVCESPRHSRNIRCRSWRRCSAGL